jgi:hypothetical protein
MQNIALAFATAKAGSSMPARMAMIAITTSSSINVKPRMQAPGGLLVAWSLDIRGFFLCPKLCHGLVSKRNILAAAKYPERPNVSQRPGGVQRDLAHVY